MNPDTARTMFILFIIFSLGGMSLKSLYDILPMFHKRKKKGVCKWE